MTEALSWILPVIMAPIVARRHSPAAAIAWIILIFFKPWLGILCYLLVGDNIVTRGRKKSYCQALAEMRAFHSPAFAEPHLFSPVDETENRHLVELTRKLVCMPILGGNSVQLLDNGHRVIERIIEDIDAAQEHVHFLFYIFNDDAVGARVADALARASRRGVKCRVVLDAFGSRSLRRSLAKRMRQENIELFFIMPVNPYRRHQSRLDLRNHRKLVVVDGRIGYTGSQNIESKDYDHARAEAWHDLMARVEGPVVLQLQLVFAEDWYFAKGEILEGIEAFPLSLARGDVSLQVLPSGPGDATASLRDLLIVAINGATEQITITSPYFVPDESFLTALHLASLRGVKVDLLIPKHTDHPIIGGVARAYISELIDSGLRVHFHGGLLHSKTMSVDCAFGIIGSANFDHRSFFLHSELSLLVYSRETVATLREKQMAYMAQSELLDPVKWNSRSQIKKMRDVVLKLLSPLL